MMVIENKITENGDYMKNDLTAEEWVVLADYLDKEDRIFDLWKKDKSLGKNTKLLRSAQRKFFQTARDIRLLGKNEVPK